MTQPPTTGAMFWQERSTRLHTRYSSCLPCKDRTEERSSHRWQNM